MMQKVQLGTATLYNADYREVIDTLADSVVVSDPPYGIGYQYDNHIDAGGGEYLDLIKPLAGKKLVLLQYPEETMRYFLPLFGVPDDCVAWCYNSNTPRQFRLWSFFGIKPDFNAYKVPAKNIGDKRVSSLVRSYDWFDDIQQVKNVSEEKTEHPCQIAVSQMERIISLTRHEFIADPFMGSGSTGVACANLNKNFIGVEKDPKYFDIACDRIFKAMAQERLFA
jgi:DNA modification methylase